MIKLDDLHVPAGVAPEPWQVRMQGSQYKPPVAPSPDLTRVLSLPRREQVEPGSPRAEALIKLITARYAKTRTTPCRCALPKPDGHDRACITTLNLAQAWALYELGTVGGLLGPIGPGHGKTLIGIFALLALLPPDEIEPRKFEGVLLVPPILIKQLISEYDLISEHFRVPSLVVHGLDIVRDVGASEPVLHVLAYSRLQRPEATVLLKKIKPRAIIADEAHYLRNTLSVRTHRVESYIRENQNTRFAGWTGTITDSSLHDYAHLSKWALRFSSPLPINNEIVKEWASALDPKSDWPADPGALLEGLTAHGFMSPGEHVQRGFHRRFVSTEGVVTTRTPPIDAELRVIQRQAPPLPNTPLKDERAPDGVWPGIADALRAVRDVKIRPDGEILLLPTDVARCCRELACGFFYRWVYPRGEAEDLIELWFERRKAWRAELREMMAPERRREHMDSPFLLTLAAMRAHGDIPSGGTHEVIDEETGDVVVVDTAKLPVWRSVHWPKWREVKDLVKPKTEAVRLDDYLAKDAAAWARDNRGVVWYDKTAFGLWVSELSGLPIYEGGIEAGVRLIGGEYQGRFYPGEDGSRSIVCSIPSHGTGRDGLQLHFNTQLIANPMSSATGWGQLLARLFRIRQKAPVVTAEFYCHTEELQASYHQARSRAAYIQRTIGTEQHIADLDDEE